MRKNKVTRIIFGVENNWPNDLIVTVLRFEGLKCTKRKVMTIIYAFVSVLLLSLESVSAATMFLDDFEDQNHDGWGVTATSGGTTGVKYVNESNWAYAYNAHGGKLSLSREFDYSPDYTLSFDMQALANAGRGNYNETFHSASGVTVSFENNFNVSLGNVSFVYATSSSLLPSNSYAISNTPDTFEALMSEWASIALVDPTSNISSIVLEFWSKGHGAQVPRGRAGPAEVRFDNVLVATGSTPAPVPVPAALWLFLSALAFIRFTTSGKCNK